MPYHAVPYRAMPCHGWCYCRRNRTLPYHTIPYYTTPHHTFLLYRYELFVPAEFAVHLYDRLVEAGDEFGLVHAGLKALGSLRMEKVGTRTRASFGVIVSCS